jgi:hypothetical protein
MLNSSAQEHAEAVFRSQRIRSAASQDLDRVLHVTVAPGRTSELVAANIPLGRLESSDPMHPSQDLARAHRIIDRLPPELASQYILKKPLILEFERVSRDCVVASFPKSDSWMSGDNQDHAEEELLIWMTEELQDLDKSDPSNTRNALSKKWRVLHEYLERTDLAQLGQE